MSDFFQQDLDRHIKVEIRVRSVAFLPNRLHQAPSNQPDTLKRSMRRFAWVLVSLGLLVVVFFLLEVASLRRPSPDCSGRVVIVPGPRGMPMECVCDEGRMAKCFNPGP